MNKYYTIYLMGAGFLFSIPAHERIIRPGYITAWQAATRILLADRSPETREATGITRHPWR
jgi:hypothetical protein